MAKFVDRTGLVYGRLTVINKTDARKNSGAVVWLCRCSCGRVVTASGTALQSGDKQSCGCYFLEVAAAKGRAKKKHGMTNSRAYSSWCNMRQRCLNPKNKKFSEYGGRGILVCDRWEKFENFLEDMGEPKEGDSLDRIDVNGDYEKNNCRWASQFVQQNNRRDNVEIWLDGERNTLAQYARDHGLSEDKIQQRLKRRWSVEKACSP